MTLLVCHSRYLTRIQALCIALILLGRRQVVRHRFLESAFVGSNPTAPAKFSNNIFLNYTLCTLLKLPKYKDHLWKNLKVTFDYSIMP